MFGLKLFTKTKTKKFATDKDRRRYYAIQGYYKNKSRTTEKDISKQKSSQK